MEPGSPGVALRSTPQAPRDGFGYLLGLSCVRVLRVHPLPWYPLVGAVELCPEAEGLSYLGGYVLPHPPPVSLTQPLSFRQGFFFYLQLRVVV